MKFIIIIVTFIATSSYAAFECDRPTDDSLASAHFPVLYGTKCSSAYNNEKVKMNFTVGKPDVTGMCKTHMQEAKLRVCALTGQKLASFAHDQSIKDPFQLTQLKLDRKTVLKAGPVKEEDFQHQCFWCTPTGFPEN